MLYFQLFFHFPGVIACVFSCLAASCYSDHILSYLDFLPVLLSLQTIAGMTICWLFLILSGNPVIFALPGSCIPNTWCTGRCLKRSWEVPKPVVHSCVLKSTAQCLTFHAKVLPTSAQKIFDSLAHICLYQQLKPES